MLTSLRGKLIFIFIILTVSVVIISSGYARYKQRQFALEQARERALTDLHLIDSDIRSVLQWIRRDLLMLRDLPQLRRLLDKGDHIDRTGVGETVLNIARHHRIFRQIGLFDLSGNQVLRVDCDRDTTCRQVPAVPGAGLADQPFFRAARRLRAGAFLVSTMEADRTPHAVGRPPLPVLRYATPILNREGRKNGILILTVFGSTFLDIIARQQDELHGGEVYFLLDRNGHYLYHPVKSWHSGTSSSKALSFFQQEPELAQWLRSSERGVVIRRSRQTYRQTLFAFQRIHFTSLVGTGAAAGGRLANNGGAGSDYWILMTSVDDANLLVGFQEYVRSLLIFTLLLLIICIITAILVAWNCSRPIVSLARAAKEIQQGDLSARAEVYSGDDMGKFARLFNEMADKLEKTIRRLQLSESNYRQIFENSRDCIFVTDTHCTIIDINKAGMKLLGLDETSSPDELALTCASIEHGFDHANNAILEEIHRKGYVKDFETYLRRPDGSRRHCTMTATARYDENGNLVGYEGILRDITEVKRQEEARAAFQKQLQEEIVLAEERQRRHIGQVLHEEMAQNLALVNLKIQEVEDRAARECDSINSTCRKLVEQLREARELISVMIRQIRTMIFDLYPTVLDDQGLVPAMLWYADNFAKRTGVRVSVYGIPGTLGLSESQMIYMFRSYKELLHNAWKHASAREIVATVKKKGNHVRLTVDDEGQGFDTGRLEEAGRGLGGLGLMSIRQWTTAMNGTLSIESQPGKGTRVSIDIPIDTTGRAPGPDRTPDPGPGPADAGSTGGQPPPAPGGQEDHQDRSGN